jgi:hypothetical protein
LRPIIARTFPFDEIVAAHRYVETGAQFGKVIVTVWHKHYVRHVRLTNRDSLA